MPAERSSEGCGLLGHGRLLVGGLVLVDDALRDGLVQLGGRRLQGVLGGVLVAGVGGLAELADPGAKLALDRLVALGGLLVGLDALELLLDVRHVRECFLGRKCVAGRGRQARSAETRVVRTTTSTPPGAHATHESTSGGGRPPKRQPSRRADVIVRTARSTANTGSRPPP